MKHYQFYILWLFVCVIAFYSCSKDEDIFLGNDEIEKPEGPGQPDNIVISLVASGLQDIIDIRTSSSFQFDIERSVDAGETVALFAKLTEEEVNEELNDEHTYKYFSDEQWTIDDNPIVFTTGETKKSVTVSFTEPPRTDVPQVYVLGLYLRSFTEEAKIESTKSKIIFRVEIPAKEGTATNPHLLSSVDDLLAMKVKVDAIAAGEEIYFELRNDIDLAGASWMPLVDAGGNLDWGEYRIIHFNGNNHKISNWSCEGTPYASFFGVLIGSCKDVTFENAVVSGTGRPVGIVAGAVGHWGYSNPRTEIVNTHVSGSVDGEVNLNWDWGNPAFAIGGICGVLRQGSSILNSSSSANVSGTAAGGIVGDCNNGGGGSISGCFYKGGTVTAIGGADAYAGGITARIANCRISNCYSSGTISSENGKAAGGITGELSPNTTISNCYSTAKVIANTNAGGIVGRTDGCSNSTVEGCIAWNHSVTSLSDLGSGLITGWINGSNLTLQRCFSNYDIPLVVNGNSIDVSAEFTEDKINAYINDYRYNGGRAANTLKETVGKLELGWSTDIWDLAGDAPKLKWESVIVVE